MNEQLRIFPFRWLLPALQFSICLISLWPYRYILVFELSSSIESYVRAKPGTALSQPLHIDIPTLNPEQQKAFDRAERIEYLRMRVPMALNFPVAIVQLPYVILNPAKTEWVPRGMLTETWRAISWPFAGVLFWWSVGRGIEALRSSRKAIISPRITLAETILAALFVCLGIVVLVGAVTTTPDDRRDLQFIALLVGGLLWGILASVTILALSSGKSVRRRKACLHLRNVAITLISLILINRRCLETLLQPPRH
jgi:hypothetical protein